jgi:RNA polymerase sigma-70 factor (ECF subfamily)
MRAKNDVNELESLATRASSGDKEAFAALVEQTHSTAYRLALRLLAGDQAEAEDVVQETYIRAWKGLAKLRDHGAVVGWLCKVTRNVATDRIRHNKRRRADSLDRNVGADLGPLVDYIASDDPNPEEITASAQLQGAMAAVIAQLKEKHRVVLLLREVDGMSYEELAVALGVPIGTVESRLHRARRELAKKLERLLRKHDKESS